MMLPDPVEGLVHVRRLAEDAVLLSGLARAFGECCWRPSTISRPKPRSGHGDAGRASHVRRHDELRTAGLDHRSSRLPLWRRGPDHRPCMASHAEAFSLFAAEAVALAGYQCFEPDACLVNR